MIGKIDSLGSDQARIVISGRVILKFANRHMIVIERSRIAKITIAPSDDTHFGLKRSRLCWLYFDDEREWEFEASFDQKTPEAKTPCSMIFDSIIHETDDVIWQQTGDLNDEPSITWVRRVNKNKR